MTKVASSVLELIGHTPLVEIGKLAAKHNAKAKVVAKLESFNVAGSVKDRVALSLIRDAEERGVLQPGATIIEPTSGNTGIGLALVSAVRGYHLILTMPETMSIERRKLLKAYGAELVLTPGAEGMKGAIAMAEKLHSETSGSVILGQFDNAANPKAHYDTTAVEIYDDLDGKVDMFVACAGTGGTVSGTGLRLKNYNNNIKIVAVEPASSPVLSGGKPGPHKIQGIGPGFVPKIYRSDVVDEVVTVTNEEAMSLAREVVVTEGILVGISSGAALAAALKLASREENAGKTIVVLLPDTGERYLSSELFSDDNAK